MFLDTEFNQTWDFKWDLISSQPQENAVILNIGIDEICKDVAVVLLALAK